MIVLVGVASWVLTCHWRVLSSQALSIDDNQYLTQNPLVQSPSWESAGRFLREVREPSTVRGYYQPLAMISLMIDYGLGGRADNLEPFHRTSLTLHVLNTVLICVLLYLLFHQLWVAALVGLLFGVHPLTVEPVAWLAERKTMLATFFALISLVVYVLYTRRATWQRYVGCAVALALALLSKPTSTPLPVLMLLLDYWPLRRLGRRALLEKVPLVLIAGLAAVVTIISQSRTSVLRTPVEHSVTSVAQVLCHNIVFYLYKLVWPADVSGNYAFPSPLSLGQPMVLAGVVGTCVLIPLLLIAWRWTRAPLTAWLFFFVAAFPTMGVIGFTNVIAADKFAYLPMLGFLLVPAWALGHLWGGEADARHRRLRRAGIVVLVLACAGLATAGTRAHLVHWRDSISLYRHMVRICPNSAAAHHNLGLLLVKQGRHAEAAEHFAATVRIKPHHDRAHRELGLALERLGRVEEAVPHYQEALRINPGSVTAHLNMASVLRDRGQFDEALAHYQAALRIRPDYFYTHVDLAQTLFELGDFAAAVEHYRKAVRLRPHDAPLRYNLGVALLRLRRYEEAIEAFRETLRLDPDHVQAQEALKKAMRIRGGSGG